MVTNNVPVITSEKRFSLNNIIEDQFNSFTESYRLLSYSSGNYVNRFDYTDTYQPGKNNIIYSHDGKPLMCVFEFSMRNMIKIYKILELTYERPTINAIRVYPNTVIPMHIDPNKGNIGRNNPILSIVTSGADGVVYMSNKTDGSRQVAVPGLSQFIMCPDTIAHGAKSGSEPYTLLQIQLIGEKFRNG